ncbi:Flavohemoglobin expression-modulating QEGLA motif protein [Planctomycetales bacterium 10988]|nr:Flavohemoglobin expression-modulating QEGLA motif protein [Planctomycetales bacterium 10988]
MSMNEQTLPPEPTKIQHLVHSLSERLVEAQRDIRILDAIKWDESVEEQFFADHCQELPQVDRRYYDSRPLNFDPDQKQTELEELEQDIHRQLGQYNPIGAIMRRMCQEYEVVVEMLATRGTPAFSRKSRELYGSAGDVFYAGEPTLADLGKMMSESLHSIEQGNPGLIEERIIPAEDAVVILQQRLDNSMPSMDQPMRVLVSDGIVADAAAGADYIKLRSGAFFNERDLRLLEVHEGWVHLGTTLNGKQQPYCTFLSKGPPSSTITQEGLAILIELVTFSSYPDRLRKITNRIRAVEMAEDGADFLEVFHFFQEADYNERDSFTLASRIFRGSTPTGGPFTKDLSYSKGFVLIYNYIIIAVKRGLLDRIPMLFCGKATLADLKPLQHAVEEGLVVPPDFVPPQFADVQALSAWMCYSNFLRHLDLRQIERDYEGIL